MMITRPAGPTSDSITDIRSITMQVPIEASGKDQFWLMSEEKHYFTNDRERVETSLWLRCRHCNFGYNGGGTYVTIDNLLRIGEEAYKHAGECPRTGRALLLTSHDTGL